MLAQLRRLYEWLTGGMAAGPVPDRVQRAIAQEQQQSEILIGWAQIGAIILCVIWVYYSALVFLLGGVVAETWEMRRLLRRHRVA